MATCRSCHEENFIGDLDIHLVCHRCRGFNVACSKCGMPFNPNLTGTEWNSHRFCSHTCRDAFVRIVQPDGGSNARPLP